MSQKHLPCLAAAAALLALTSCSIKEDRILCDLPVPVHVRVSGFSVSQEDFPGTKAAQSVADYTGIKAITLAFYDGDTEAYKVTQLRSDTSTYDTFGEFDLALPMGSYTLVVLGYGLNAGEPAITLTSPTAATFGEYPARETFAATQEIDISSTSAVDISATLSRIISKIGIHSSDLRTANAHSIRITFAAGGKTFSPSSGLATVNAGSSITVPISTAVGAASGTAAYLFLASDEQTMDVTIETLDEGGNVLFSQIVEDVSFKRNRITNLTGAMYTNDSVEGSFQLETAWLTEHDINF